MITYLRNYTPKLRRCFKRFGKFGVKILHLGYAPTQDANLGKSHRCVIVGIVVADLRHYIACQHAIALHSFSTLKSSIVSITQRLFARFGTQHRSLNIGTSLLFTHRRAVRCFRVGCARGFLQRFAPGDLRGDLA